MPRSRREIICERAHGCCEYCQMPQDLDVGPFQVDHNRAEKHRGTDDLSNLAWACLPCNSYKGPNVAGYDPETQTLQRLFNPRLDKWIQHFKWSGATLLGRTPVGRTTIDVLRINARDRTLHRELLIETRLFPQRPI